MTVRPTSATCEGEAARLSEPSLESAAACAAVGAECLRVRNRRRTSRLIQWGGSSVVLALVGLGCMEDPEVAERLEPQNFDVAYAWPWDNAPGLRAPLPVRLSAPPVNRERDPRLPHGCSQI